MNYEKENINPKNNTSNDCVIRALAKTLNKNWDEVYLKLCDLGFQMKRMPNDDEVWKDYAISNGFKYCKLGNLKGKTRPTVDSFCNDHKSGTYIVTVAHHIVAIVDGKFFDIWNNGNKSLYGYWEKI